MQEAILFCFFVAAILGAIPAMIAHKKGYSFLHWWLIGTAFFILALPAALLLDPKGAKKCPYCKEMVRGDAVVCRFCCQQLARSGNAGHRAPCPYCGRTTRLFPYVAGKATRCEHCHKPFTMV